MESKPEPPAIAAPDRLGDRDVETGQRVQETAVRRGPLDAEEGSVVERVEQPCVIDALGVPKGRFESRGVGVERPEERRDRAGVPVRPDRDQAFEFGGGELGVPEGSPQLETGSGDGTLDYHAHMLSHRQCSPKGFDSGIQFSSSNPVRRTIT
jgi:hypothetical protein